MNILILCNKFPWPEKDGYSHAVMAMIRSMHKAGCRLSVLAMNTQKHYVDLGTLPAEFETLAQFTAVEVDNRVNFWDMGINALFSKLPYSVERFTTEGFKEAIKQLLSKQKFDIIQLEGLFLTPYIPLIRSISQAKIVYRVHNLENEIWHRLAAQEGIWLKKAYLRELAQRLEKYEWSHLKANSYDALVPISARDLQAIRDKKVATPAHTACFGMDLSHIQPATEKAEPMTVCYLGSLDWLPNQEGVRWLVTQVWPKIRALYPTAELFIAGRKMPVGFLHEYAGKEGVNVVGEVENAQAFINRYQVLAVPLMSGGGMRIKIVEGLALARPMVVTSVALEGIAAKHGKDVYIADSVQDFVNGIGTYLEHPNIAEGFAKNARQLALSHFDIHKITGALLEFYRGLLGEENS